MQHGAVRMNEMESNKISEFTSPSDGETSERGTTKNEKTHKKINLFTFEKKVKQKAKLWWRRFTQYKKMTPNIDLNLMTTDKEYKNYIETNWNNGSNTSSFGNWAHPPSLRCQEPSETAIRTEWI